jgi:hypothetical protein
MTHWTVGSKAATLMRSACSMYESASAPKDSTLSTSSEADAARAGAGLVDGSAGWLDRPWAVPSIAGGWIGKAGPDKRSGFQGLNPKQWLLDGPMVNTRMTLLE